MLTNERVLKRPIALTEKANQLRGQNKVVFEVDRTANSVQIKRAVESLFNVKVERVNTLGRARGWERVRVVSHGHHLARLRLTCRRLGLHCDATAASQPVGLAADKLALNMPVEAVFEDVTPQVTLLKFRPAGGKA